MKNTLCNIRRQLIYLTKQPIDLVVNRNKSTFIKVIFQTPILVSIHEAFLHANTSILHSLAQYILGHKNEEDSLYTYILNHTKLYPTNSVITHSKGDVYDLHLLYKKLNKTYFQNALTLQTTWWKEKHASSSSICTLGQFIDTLNLIKIHSLLDQAIIPHYVVENVLFHEMLHAIVPHKRTPNGRTSVHHKEFRSSERVYPLFDKAEAWLQAHRFMFFKHRQVLHKPSKTS